MASILVVCTGNVCRSPAAEAFLRRALVERLGAAAPVVASAGTAGWAGSGATPESVRATAERGVDTSRHLARVLTRSHIEEADLILTMTQDHTDRIDAAAPGAAARTFTLKELVLLLEADETAGGGIEAALSADLRRPRGRPAADLDVADPYGMSMDGYRDMAAELKEWTERLAEALFGPVPATAAGAGA